MRKDNLELLLRSAGTYKLAKRIGIRHQSVISWIKRGRVPLERVAAVEAITGVSRHALRPDFFGPAPTQPSNQEAA